MKVNRFRYRVWDKINKKMHTGLPYSAVGKVTFDVILKHPQIYEVMQYADVTDNDGIMIFEGDYISDGETIWEVKYRETMSGFSAKAVGGRLASNSSWFSLYHLCNGYNEGRSVRVVGNIYENKRSLLV